MSLCGMPVVIRNYNFSRSDKLQADANDVMFSAGHYLSSMYPKTKERKLIKEFSNSFSCFSESYLLFARWCDKVDHHHMSSFAGPCTKLGMCYSNMYLVSSDKLIDNTHKKRS
jgi:hypothetical protein